MSTVPQLRHSAPLVLLVINAADLLPDMDLDFIAALMVPELVRTIRGARIAQDGYETDA